MNRLRGRKKTVEEEPEAQSSTKSDFSFPFKMLSRFKKSYEEPEPEVEFSTSLPPTSNDDFRISILMADLSARFSLLRESPTKNSPKTRGSSKVRDDIALYTERHFQIAPRKQCNCQNNDRGSPERPATRSGRIEGRRAEAQEGESIMNRGRTTESNNLFGGRQKVNIIPSNGSCGRALYCDDIGPSTFQRWRQREKERNAAEGNDPGHASRDSIALSYSQGAPPVPSIDYREHSLPPEQNRDRTLGPSRTGTLPTSIQTTGLDGSPERTSRKMVRTKASEPDFRSFLHLDPGTPPPMPTEISPTVRESKKIPPSLPTSPLSATAGDLDSGSRSVKENRKIAALGLQSRPSVKYDEEEYVRRQRQIQSRKATANPSSRTDTNKKQINRRSRSFQG